MAAFIYRCKLPVPFGSIHQHYQKQQQPLQNVWGWVIMTAYGSVYLCKLFVPLWSILCRDHFHTKFLSLTSCSTYQACSSVKITQVLHQNVGAQRSIDHMVFFSATFLKLHKTRLRENYQGWYLKILKKKSNIKAFFRIMFFFGFSSS